LRRLAVSVDTVRGGAVLGMLLLSLGCLNRPLPAQEVYKSVDAEGHVVYSDRGNTKNAPKTTVHVDQPDPDEAARLAKEQARLQAEDAQRTKQQAVDDRNTAAEERRKQTACQNARNNYNRLVDPGRLFHRDADGNRIFYTDDEIAAMRADARRAATQACGAAP
jgi:Domain of unknown function (DUF4124)